MDIISFNEASTANSRIDIINANPDSESGLITVPKVIASGESVTVPEGRIAVLPNVQVDGELNVEGEIFVPSGSTIDFTNGITVDGNRLVMSVPTAYHIYNGSVEATNTVVTNGFSTTLHTGNGTTQSVTTGVDMATQWGNTTEETFGGLVWLKDRVSAGSGHVLADTIRGVNHYLQTNNTNADTTLVGTVTAFNNNGFTIGNQYNINGAGIVSWNFQTTHRKTGTTNHGKAYTEHYNPYTGFTIIKYEGSGIAGHEIPHSLGRKLGFVTFKNLNAVTGWQTHYNSTNRLVLNIADAQLADYLITINNTNCTLLNDSGTNINWNGSTNQHIMYGWANSYFDESNKLIGNYEIGVYQGTGVAGNKITTRGKPAWVMIKRLDSAASWITIDNIRGDNELYPNLTNIEASFDRINIVTDGFTLSNGDANSNASGGQYLYMVVYDNDSGSGKSKYPKATDTTNLAINALVPYANGIDVNGSKVSISYKNETISGLTLTQGKNYPYSKNDGTYGSIKYMPMYGALRDRSVAGENPDYFDLETRKWYGTSGGNELVTNGDGISLASWQGVSYNGSTIVADASVLTLSNQTFLLTNAGGKAWSGMVQTLTGLTIGKKYKLVFDVIANSAGVNILVLEASTVGTGGTNLSRIFYNGNKQSYDFTATLSTMYLLLATNSGTVGHISQLDSISVFELTPTIGVEITPRTYLDCVVYADHNGQVEYVEELPKTTYFDEIKANEYRGKNACTAWVNFDGTTTPPTIRDSYNVASVVRIAGGQYDIYFKEAMDNTNYSINITSWRVAYYSSSGDQVEPASFRLNKTQIIHFENATNTNSSIINVHIYGGKN